MEVEDKYLKYWRDRRQRQQEMNQLLLYGLRGDARVKKTETALML